MSFQFRYFKPLLALVLGSPAVTLAIDVNVVGLFPGKGAVVVINGAAPRAIKLGQKTAEGVQLIAVDKDTATLEIDGKRRALAIGQHHAGGTTVRQSGTITLSADPRGHFITTGAINGGTVRLMVDTGATVVVLPSSDAERLGIDYNKGIPSAISTANGSTIGWKVKLDTVKLGDVSINNVDGIVLEASALPIALLGMSFLNRFEMRRDGEVMTLTKRY